MKDDAQTGTRTLLPAMAILSLLLTQTGTPARAQSQDAASIPLTIRVTAKKFEFEPKVITVQKGQPVKLIIKAVDTVHGFAIKEFNINVKLKQGETKSIVFTPDRAGEFRIYCSVYCGEGHDDMTGRLIVTDSQAAGESKIRVTFDPDRPGIAVVESGGERVTIDTSAKTVVSLNQPPAAAPQAGQQQPVVAKAEAKETLISEPYDYRLVNVPTPKRVVKHSLNLYFTHRFSEPVKPLRQSARDLLGLDSFSASSLGLFYGITDRLYVSAYRSPICQTGLCRTIEIGLGYHWLDEAGRSPVALSTYASVEGDGNFSERFTYNVQAMVARSVTKYVSLFFSPAVHINANGQRRFDPKPGDFFPPAAVADNFRQDRNAGSFGFGVNARIRPSTSLLFEYTPRVGFKLGRVTPIFDQNFAVTGFKTESEAEIGFGVEKDVGRHTFSLTFSNTQTTTTSRYNSSNLVLPPKQFIIGFNLYRRFLK
jgi:cytochrome c oxidase subunit 2